MKVYLFLIFSFLITTPIWGQVEYNQWGFDRTSKSTELHSITFVNKNVGFITGNKKVAKTIDGGDYWYLILDNVDAKTINFVDQNTGVLIIADQIHYTSNGGNEWSRVFTGYSTLTDLHIINNQIGWAIGNYKRIYKTNGALTNWVQHPYIHPASFVMNAIFFSTDSTGWIVGSTGTGLKTTDAGETWSALPADFGSENLVDVYFTNDSTGWIIESQGEIYKSTNYGLNWNSSQSGINNLRQIKFINNLVGYITGGNGKVVKTTDGGETWIIHTTFTQNNLSGMYFFNPDTGIVIGSKSTVIKTIGGAASGSCIEQMLGDENNFNDMDLIPGRSIIVGENGTILYAYPTSGYNIQTFGQKYLPASLRKNLNSASFTDGSNVVIVGDSGFVLKFVNFSNGSLGVSGTNEKLNSVCFTDTYNGWIVGNNGLLLKSTDIGATWVSKNVNTSNDLLKVVFLDSLYGFIVGRNGTFIKTTDNGENWIVRSPLVNKDLMDVSFSNRLLGHISASEGLYLKTTDGGNNWTANLVFNPAKYKAIIFHDVHYQLGWIAGEHQSLHKTVNGGAFWWTESLTSPYDFCIQDLEFYKIGTSPINFQGYAVGEKGTILKFRGDPFIVIPVELKSFAGYQKDGAVHLEWETATELNNHGFEIERKIVGSDPSPWVTVGFVKGAGTTTENRTYSFMDKSNGLENHKLAYRLKQIDFDGSFNYSEEVEIDHLAHQDFVLSQNYPNPFNPNTKIKFSVPQECDVNLKIFDVLGNEIITLIDDHKEAGIYTVQFDASHLSSGLYFYKLQAGSFIETKKMILLR